jgi:hypothetical protein
LATSPSSYLEKDYDIYVIWLMGGQRLFQTPHKGEKYGHSGVNPEYFENSRESLLGISPHTISTHQQPTSSKILDRIDD